jgi:protein-S-isoprenylcysteine O-methyltransferase Ste14
MHPVYDLPALSLFVVMLAYWGRVAAMSWRIRRRTRTLSGVVPEQSLERFLWWFFVPVVALWIVLPLLAGTRAGGSAALPAIVREGAWLVLRWCAVAVAAGLLVATIRCWKRMGRHWKMAVTPGERQVLITDGPFARVRHPIYGYQVLLMLASLAVVPTLPMLAIAAVHLALMLTKARNEEAYLLGVHGEAYAAYMARTGRFFPKSPR